MNKKEIPDNHSFFTVWKDGSQMMQKKHSVRGEAIAEAERLAEINPGSRYFIMRAVGHVKGKVELEIILEPGA